MKQFKEFNLSHAGVSLAVEICSMSNPKTTRDENTPIESNGSKFVKIFEQKGFYSGEVQGMIEAIQTFASTV